MKIRYQQFDFGFTHGWALKRGPFRHGVSVHTRWGTRVSRTKRARAVRALREWVKGTHAPAFKLQIMRMRLKASASTHRTGSRAASLRARLPR